MSKKLFIIPAALLTMFALSSVASAQKGKSAAAIKIDFASDFQSATYSSNKGLSNFTVTLCSGTVIKNESVGGDFKNYTFGPYTSPIVSVRAKAGTTNQTFNSGVNCGDSANDAGSAEDGSDTKQPAAPNDQEKAQAEKVSLCHATGSESNPYTEITISKNALKAHLDHQEGEDIYPVPAVGCPEGSDNANSPGQNEKVSICHATNSDSNPFVEITISKNALPAHLSHQDGQDIFPIPATGCPEGVEREASNNRVTICHQTGSESNPWVEITISDNALSAHLAHEDLFPVPAGGCPVPSDDGMVTAEDESSPNQASAPAPTPNRALRAGPRPSKCVALARSVRVRVGQANLIRVALNRATRGVRVRVSGAGVRAVTKRTDAKGQVVFRVNPKKTKKIRLVSEACFGADKVKVAGRRQAGGGGALPNYTG